jgi:hypothetical protein
MKMRVDPAGRPSLRICSCEFRITRSRGEGQRRRGRLRCRGEDRRPQWAAHAASRRCEAPRQPEALPDAVVRYSSRGDD